MTGHRRRILVATADTIAPEMAGPAIRAWHIAATLAEDGHDVRLVSTTRADLRDERFAVGPVDERKLRAAVDWCEILVFQGWLLAGRPWIAEADKVIVADVYDPMHLEQLEQARDGGDEAHRAAVRGATGVLNDQMLRADFLLCASELQRSFWLGHLASIGRVNPRTYDADPTLRALIDVAPFGIEAPPVADGHGLRGVVPGIGPNDLVLLWGGGIYNWFDPVTLIEAVVGLVERHPTVRLVFMGGAHPNPEIPEMAAAVAARGRADALGLAGRHVFFNEGWVPYRERHRVLLDADIGVSTHLDHVETAFSFRTRVLDYLWASLPVVTTGGDALGELVEARGAGLTVDAGDVEGLEAALDTLLADQDLRARCRAAARALAPELRWPETLAPLVRFCRAPRRAPDLVDPITAAELSERPTAPPRKSWRTDVALARQYLREGGVGLLMRRAGARLRRLLRR